MTDIKTLKDEHQIELEKRVLDAKILTKNEYEENSARLKIKVIEYEKNKLDFVKFKAEK